MAAISNLRALNVPGQSPCILKDANAASPDFKPSHESVMLSPLRTLPTFCRLNLPKWAPDWHRPEREGIRVLKEPPTASIRPLFRVPQDETQRASALIPSLQDELSTMTKSSRPLGVGGIAPGMPAINVEVSCLFPAVGLSSPYFAVCDAGIGGLAPFLGTLLGLLLLGGMFLAAPEVTSRDGES